MRVATVERNTKETRISGSVDLDGTGAFEISTGVGFLDHMLEQLARHGRGFAGRKGICTSISTIPPRTPAIVIGEAVSSALGDRAGHRALRRTRSSRWTRR